MDKSVKESVKDLVKAITELQTERKKVNKIKEDLAGIPKDMSLLYENLCNPAWLNSYSEKQPSTQLQIDRQDATYPILNRVYNTVKEAFKRLKKLRKSQNYPIKKIISALESISEQRTETTFRINMGLRNDVKIQEIVEKRNRVLERLCNRLVGLIKLKKKRDRDISGLISDVYAINNVLIPTIHYIIAELDSETVQLNSEISSLSAQIDQLKGE